MILPSTVLISLVYRMFRSAMFAFRQTVCFYFCTQELLFNKRNLIGQTIHFARTFSAKNMFRNRKSGKKKNISIKCIKTFDVFSTILLIRLFTGNLDCENCFKSIIVCLHIPFARVI